MKTKTTKKRTDRSLSRTCIFDPVRRLLQSLDEMPTCMNGKLKQYNLPPAMLDPSVEVHLDDADDGSSDLYVSLTAHDANEPILRLSYDPKDDAVRIQVFANTHGHRGEATHTVYADVPGRKCPECNGRGYAIFNGNEIQRCDTCKQFDTDEEAAAEVERLLDETYLPENKLIKDLPQRQAPEDDPNQVIIQAIKTAMADNHQTARGRDGEDSVIDSSIVNWRPDADDYENVRNRIRGVYGRAPTCAEWIAAGYNCNCDGKGG